MRQYVRRGGWPATAGTGESPAVPALAAAPPYGRELVKGQWSLRRLTLEGTAPGVNLLLPELDTSRIYAGVTTALTAAGTVAASLGFRLRVMTLAEPAVGSSTEALRAWVATHLPDGERMADAVDLVPRSRLADEPLTGHDVWVVTYWTTALAAAYACREGSLDRGRVIYLVQDFEPAFNAWGDRYALAAGTYRQGFAHLVNSLPLARYLGVQTEVPVDEDHVFAPALDLEPLRAAAEAWRPPEDGVVRALFYARPNHPRNLYRLGVEGLRRWVDAEVASGRRPHVVAAGDAVAPVDLGHGLVMEGVGKLSMADYHALLSRVDLGLALMHSPHPSHLPLELGAAGIPTVTNTLGSFRTAWLPGLELADPDPASIGEALTRAAGVARALTRHRFAEPTGLGRPLEQAVVSLLAARGLRRPAVTG